MRTKALAIIIGILCHTSFAAAVITMAIALYGGMNRGSVAQSYTVAICLDLLLLFQFPILHTLLLRPSGRKFLSGIFPGDLGRHLVTTTFVIAASSQLLALFGLWSHLGAFEWAPSGILRNIWNGVYVVSWALLAIAMTNAGLGTQMGYLGWSSMFRGKPPAYPSFPRRGLYKVCRHPVYFAMALVSCTGPIWNIDHIIIASVFLTYCVIGPIVKERRLSRTFGPDFKKHFDTIPFFPTPSSCWRVAQSAVRTQRGL